MKKKTYLVRDNSFQQCLSDGINYLLAGTISGPRGQTVQMVTPPFKRTVINRQNEEETHRFIVGKCKKGLYHLILYHP